MNCRWRVERDRDKKRDPCDERERKIAFEKNFLTNLKL